MIRRAAVKSVNKFMRTFGREKDAEACSFADNGEHLINGSHVVENSHICMQLFKLLLESEDSCWIPGCLAAAVFGECYVIMIGNSIVVSSDTYQLETELSDSRTREIRKGFDNLWPQVRNVYRSRGSLL